MTIRHHGAPRAPPCDQRGMTLIELLVATSISLVLGGMIIVRWWALTSSYASTVKRGKASDFARPAVAMEREVRDAEQPPASVTETVASRGRARITSSSTRPSTRTAMRTTRRRRPGS